MRADVEQTDDVLVARKQIFQGDRSYADNDLVAARNAYHLGFQGLAQSARQVSRHGSPPWPRGMT